MGDTPFRPIFQFSIFFSHVVFHVFFSRKWSPNLRLFVLFARTSICQKLVFRLDGSHIFQVWSLEKSYQNSLQNRLEKNTRIKFEFTWNFTLFWPLLGALGRLWATFWYSFFYEGSNIVPKRASSAIWVRFWKDLGGSGEHLYWISGEFGEDFARFSEDFGWFLLKKLKKKTWKNQPKIWIGK